MADPKKDPARKRGFRDRFEAQELNQPTAANMSQHGEHWHGTLRMTLEEHAREHQKDDAAVEIGHLHDQKAEDERSDAQWMKELDERSQAGIRARAADELARMARDQGLTEKELREEMKKRGLGNSGSTGPRTDGFYGLDLSGLTTVVDTHDADSLILHIKDGTDLVASPAFRLLLNELGFNATATSARIGNSRALDPTQSAEGTKARLYWAHDSDNGLKLIFERKEI